MCLVCSAWSGAPLCDACRAGLREAPGRRIASPGGATVLVASAYWHEAAARALVHALKYRGTVAAASVLAPAMAAVLPGGAAEIVPVPRARLRAWRYGLDPAAELGRQLGRLTGIPVVRALRPAWWWPRHAGQDRQGRSAPARLLFSRTADLTAPVLVDDVLTTGSTLLAAAGAAGPVLGAVTATAAGI